MYKQGTNLFGHFEAIFHKPKPRFDKKLQADGMTPSGTSSALLNLMC